MTPDAAERRALSVERVRVTSAAARSRGLVVPARFDPDDVRALLADRDALADALRAAEARAVAAEAREQRHADALRVRDEALADIAEALGLHADVPLALIARAADAAVTAHAALAAAVREERARARRCAIYSERFDGYDVIDTLDSVRGMIENGDDDEVCEYCHDTGVNAASSKPCRFCGWAKVLRAAALAAPAQGAAQ